VTTYGRNVDIDLDCSYNLMVAAALVYPASLGLDRPPCLISIKFNIRTGQWPDFSAGTDMTPASCCVPR
jgi:hypothetical protein